MPSSTTKLKQLVLNDPPSIQLSDITYNKMNTSSMPELPVGIRHGQVFLLFVSIFMTMVTRLDLSVAIVAMTDLETPTQYQVFGWSSSEKGILLGMYFDGFVAGALPLSFVANRSSVRYLLSASSFISGLLALSFPLMANKGGFTAACAARVLLGLVQGVVFPCVSSHLSKWSTSSERPMFTSLAYCGGPLGTVAVQSAAGFLAASNGGWPSIFYVTGSSSLVWAAICFWFIRDFPREHTGISRGERSYIQRHGKEDAEKSYVIPVPWKLILTSGPVWALVFAACSYFWAVWTMDTMLPTYMKAIYELDIEQNGLMSALPHLGLFVSCLVSPIFSHYFAKYFGPSLTFQRKFWNSIGLFGSAACFLVMATVQDSSAVATVILTVANFLLATVHVGFKTNMLDLSPHFSALITGITNSLSQILPLLAPTLTGFILQADPDPVSAWSTVFIIAAVINCVGGLIFVIFASAETQKWNDSECTQKMGTSTEITC